MTCNDQDLPDGLDPHHVTPLGSLLARAALVLVAIAVVVALVWSHLSAQGDGDIASKVQALMVETRSLAWAPVVAVGLLVLLNVAGVPLMVLTAGTTIVFDNAVDGFAYSWTASIIGACIGFWLGKFSGGELLRGFGGDKINDVSERLGRRGLLACVIVRLVPTAPAIVVNMVIGASHIPFWKFVLGTGIGIAPKLFFIAVVTKGLLGLEADQSPYLTAGLAALVLFWLGTMVALRRYLKSHPPGRGEKP